MHHLSTDLETIGIRCKIYSMAVLCLEHSLLFNSTIRLSPCPKLTLSAGCTRSRSGLCSPAYHFGLIFQAWPRSFASAEADWKAMHL